MTTQQPEALRLAQELDAVPETGADPQTIQEAAAELRRQHTRIAELQARIKTMAEEHADELMVAHLDGRVRAAQPAGAQQPGDERAAFEAWIKKDGGDLSTFGSDQNIHYSNSAVNNAWAGWKARASHGQAPAGADMQDAYVGAREDLAIWKRRALEAERDLRAERETTSRLAAEINAINGPTHLGEPAPTAQPAQADPAQVAPAAPLPDADRDYMRKVVAVAVTMLFDGHKEDVLRVFSTSELSEFVTITAAMRGEQVEDIYRRAWDLLSLPARASHGQAPAGASKFADVIAVQRGEAESDPSDAYMVGLYNGMSMMDANYRNLPDWEPMGTMPKPSPTAQAAESVQDMQSVNDAVTIELPPLPDPDLRDVGTKPQEIKDFLNGYATEYARTAIAARAPADSVLEDAAQVEIDLFNDLNRIYGNTLTAYAKEMCRLGYRKTNAARKQGETNEH